MSASTSCLSPRLTWAMALSPRSTPPSPVKGHPLCLALATPSPTTSESILHSTGLKIREPACMASLTLTSFTHRILPTSEKVPFNSSILEQRLPHFPSPWVELRWKLTAMDTLVVQEPRPLQAARVVHTTASPAPAPLSASPATQQPSGHSTPTPPGASAMTATSTTASLSA